MAFKYRSGHINEGITLFMSAFLKFIAYSTSIFFCLGVKGVFLWWPLMSSMFFSSGLWVVFVIKGSSASLNMHLDVCPGFPDNCLSIRSDNVTSPRSERGFRSQGALQNSLACVNNAAQILCYDTLKVAIGCFFNHFGIFIFIYPSSTPLCKFVTCRLLAWAPHNPITRVNRYLTSGSMCKQCWNIAMMLWYFKINWSKLKDGRNMK